jgi:hypothetical protein
MRQLRDEGSALVIVLALIAICSMVTLPLLDYTVTASANSRASAERVRRAESVKGGLRMSLADPRQLYKACDSATATVPVTLATPGTEVGVITRCYKLQSMRRFDAATLPFALATTMVGSVLPTGAFTSGNAYPKSGFSPNTTWHADTSTTMSASKIWTPKLPMRATALRGSTPFSMPAGFTPAGEPECKVFFPGTYKDPVTITGNIQVYFASGVYYFEQPIAISGDAKVTVGGGSEPGCVSSDQEAAFYADGAPVNHGISGLGGTWVLGGSARVAVDSTGGTTGPSLVFNKRCLCYFTCNFT